MEINNCIDLRKITILPDEEFVPILQNCKLLKKTMRCSARHCRRNCKIQKRADSSLTYIFSCNSCKKKYSLMTGSFFSTIGVPPRNVLHVLWCWACEMQSKCCAWDQTMPNKRVIKIYRKIREICSWALLQEKELLGGPGHVVQIDDGRLMRRKRKDGKIEDVWLMVIYDTTIKKGLIQLVSDRATRTFQDLIISNVKLGSEVWTDSSPYYRNLTNLEGVCLYNHKIVSQSNIFLDPSTGRRNNDVKAHIYQLRHYLQKLGVMSSSYLHEYIDQYMWAKRFGPTCKIRFKNILDQISRKFVCS